MKVKIFAVALLISALMSGCACAASINMGNAGNNFAQKNFVESDPRLPAFDNPIEFDLEEGQLHISFKGVFREADTDKKTTDYITFIFVAVGKKDLILKAGIGDNRAVHDGWGTKFDNWRYVSVNRMTKSYDMTCEIIEGLPMRIKFSLKMDKSLAGEFPTVARTNFKFQEQNFQFRNIKVKEWALWENLSKELGLEP